MGRFSGIRDWRFSLATKLERKEKLKEETGGQGDKLDGDGGIKSSNGLSSLLSHSDIAHLSTNIL